MVQQNEQNFLINFGSDWQVVHVLAFPGSAVIANMCRILFISCETELTLKCQSRAADNISN